MFKHDKGRDTGNNNDKRNQYLEETTKNQAFFRFLQIFGCQTFLNNVLVKSPISYVGQPHRSKNYRQTGQFFKAFPVNVLINDHAKMQVTFSFLYFGEYSLKSFNSTIGITTNGS